MKKSARTILIDILDAILYALILVATITGFWAVIVFTTYASGNVQLAVDRWFMVAALLVAALITYSILRFLGRGARK